MREDATLTSLVDSLMGGDSIAVAEWPVQFGALEDWGLLHGPHGIVLPPGMERLREQTIRPALSHRAGAWVRSLEIHNSISSTSDRLLVLAEKGPIDGIVCLAELQTKGRGRRGRTWLTPLGGSLALSVGFAIHRPLADLGGLSLVVGLALLDTLEEFGFTSIALKWPNDLLLRGAKVGGILIELKSTSAGQSMSEAVVGVGINLKLPLQVHEAIDQEVTDLASAAIPVARNLLAARVIGSLVEFIGEFERVGFAPMREQYNAHHAMHGKHCEVRMGKLLISGRVVGVTATGEIELSTAEGPQVFGGGEVSLRKNHSGG
jgi:BirA family biotin operon repressor/biotin-[acetyl-CoA-carboxylase] ligase